MTGATLPVRPNMWENGRQRADRSPTQPDVREKDGGTYRKRRVGRNGRPFDLLKLLTMAVQQSSSSPQVIAANDFRVTRVGRWLRRPKLDELPQIWNVVVGDVSLGPRPEVQKYICYNPKDYREILRVRPGLTYRATLAYIDEESLLGQQQDSERYVSHVMPRKVALYLPYVRSPSLREDAHIFAATASGIARRVVPGFLCGRSERTQL